LTCPLDNKMITRNYLRGMIETSADLKNKLANFLYEFLNEQFTITKIYSYFTEKILESGDLQALREKLIYNTDSTDRRPFLSKMYNESAPTNNPMPPMLPQQPKKKENCCIL